jgi:hypothetical protein
VSPPRAEPGHVRLLDAEAVKHADHVDRELLDGRRPVGVGGPTPFAVLAALLDRQMLRSLIAAWLCPGGSQVVG